LKVLSDFHIFLSNIFLSNIFLSGIFFFEMGVLYKWL